MSEKTKYYVVWKGRKTGIFNSWKACEAQVKGFTDAAYKSFPSRIAAERALAGNYRKYTGKPASSGDWLFAPTPPVSASICVDAACSGSPGPLEYRGVETASGRQIFRQGPYENGTNNVGEFLAIVHALGWLKQNRLEIPVYSDSETAIGWVKKKRCNTELEFDETNAALYELLQRAEDWLDGNKVAVSILKWDTKAWGEIPADFNRK